MPSQLETGTGEVPPSPGCPLISWNRSPPADWAPPLPATIPPQTSQERKSSTATYILGKAISRPPSRLARRIRNRRSKERFTHAAVQIRPAEGRSRAPPTFWGHHRACSGELPGGQCARVCGLLPARHARHPGAAVRVQAGLAARREPSLVYQAKLALGRFSQFGYGCVGR